MANTKHIFAGLFLKTKVMYHKSYVDPAHLSGTGAKTTDLIQPILSSSLISGHAFVQGYILIICLDIHVLK